MSGYKPGYSEANSDTYMAGRADGLVDGVLIALCPPGHPTGPNPPNPAHPWMYLRGYHETFDVAEPHICTERCKR